MEDNDSDTQQSSLHLPGCSQPTCSAGNKRKRSSKATSNQIQALLAKLETQPFLATRRFNGLQGRDNFESGWKEITVELNSLLNGSIKTPDQWMTVWRDIKSRACTKAAKLSLAKKQTGNPPLNIPHLNELEKRIVSLVGAEYTIGTDCPDSMPEKEVLQCQLEAGEPIHQIIILPESDNVDVVENLSLIPDPEIAAASSQILQITTNMGPTQQQIPKVMPVTAITDTPHRTASGSRATGRTEHPVQPRRNRNLNPRRSVAEQHHSARSDFLAVAESNAESMKVLAAATKMQAEAAKMQAEASLLFAQATDKIAEALLVFTKNNKN